MKTTKKITACLWGVCAVMVFYPMGTTLASQIVFQGQNAALFPSANPADTSMLLNSTPKPAANPSSSATKGISPATLIEQSVEAQISSQIYNQIFNSSSASGTFNLGNGSIISYLRSGGNIDITITDPINGTTNITVPDVSR